MKRIVTILLVVCLPASAPHAEPLIVDGDIAVASALSDVRGRSEVLHALGDDDNAAQLLRALQNLEQDSSLGAVARQHLIDTTLQAMSGVEPDQSVRDAVAAYIGHPVEVYVQLSEEHRDIVVPLYDLSASAALTMRSWDENRAQYLVSARLAANTWEPALYSSPEAGLNQDVWRRATEKAVSSIETESLLQVRDRILKAQQAGEPLGEVALIAGRRLQDRELLLSTTSHGEQRVAIAALRATVESMPPSVALQVLRAGRQRDDIATAAVLELATLVDQQPLAYEELLGLLDDEALGGAAALALARAESPQSLADLQRIILGDQSSIKKLRAALALRLSGSDAAIALQRELRQATDIDLDLRGALR